MVMQIPAHLFAPFKEAKKNLLSLGKTKQRTQIETQVQRVGVQRVELVELPVHCCKMQNKSKKKPPQKEKNQKRKSQKIQILE
jgi:hypothetical protein